MPSTLMPAKTRTSRISLAPEPIDWLLACGAAIMLCAVLTALGRGHAEWASVPALVWAHLATIAAALVLTPIILLRRRGDRLHRVLGRTWGVCLFAAALLSFGIRDIAHGGFSPIHALSLFVLIDVPLIALAARGGHIEAHRQAVRWTIAGALLIAGFFTFPFGRLLGRWLLS